MRAWVTLFVPTITFKPLKLESSNFIHVYGFLIKKANLYFFSFLFRVISHFGVLYSPLKNFEKKKSSEQDI